MRLTLKRNFEVFSATDWLAALTAHIPNAGEHLVRYYTHLGLWPAPAHSPPAGVPVAISPATGLIAA
jgi:hypothetical protein